MYHDQVCMMYIIKFTIFMSFLLHLQTYRSLEFGCCHGRGLLAVDHDATAKVKVTNPHRHQLQAKQVEL